MAIVAVPCRCLVSSTPLWPARHERHCRVHRSDESAQQSVDLRHTQANQPTRSRGRRNAARLRVADGGYALFSGSASAVARVMARYRHASPAPGSGAAASPSNCVPRTDPGRPRLWLPQLPPRSSSVVQRPARPRRARFRPGRTPDSRPTPPARQRSVERVPSAPNHSRDN
jgi:hypothetical protein